MAKGSYWTWRKKGFELDINQDFHSFTMGISVGSNRFYKKKAANIYIEIFVAFWTIGFEMDFTGEM